MKPRNNLLLFALLGLLVVAAVRRDGSDPDKPNVLVTAKQVVIVRETTDETPQQARAYRALRDGEIAKRFADKDVVIDIVDKDGVNETGDVVIAPQDYAGQPLPAILFYAKRKGTLQHVESLGPDFTADKIVDICKRHGA